MTIPRPLAVALIRGRWVDVPMVGIREGDTGLTPTTWLHVHRFRHRGSAEEQLANLIALGLSPHEVRVFVAATEGADICGTVTLREIHAMRRAFSAVAPELRRDPAAHYRAGSMLGGEARPLTASRRVQGHG